MGWHWRDLKGGQTPLLIGNMASFIISYGITGDLIVHAFRGDPYHNSGNGGA